MERSFAWNPRFSIVRLRIELRDTISGIFTRVRIHEEEEEGEGWKSLLSAVQGIHCFRYKRGQRVETARRGVHCSASGSRERHRLSKILQVTLQSGVDRTSGGGILPLACSPRIFVRINVSINVHSFFFPCAVTRKWIILIRRWIFGALEIYDFSRGS